MTLFTAKPQSRSAARLLVSQLEIHGIDRIFCVPGESYLAVLDALVDARIDVVVCRNEAGAAMMAEAHGKLTGRPAACFVTRGPGATNAAPGLHIAQHDSTPLLLFIGQVERAFRGRGAFQEIDYREMFGAIAKWVVEIDEAARIPELIARAVQLATGGRPGPVVIALPEDMLADTADAADAPAVEAAEIHPGADQMIRLAAMLDIAERPIAILGGSRWSAPAVTSLAGLASRWTLPVAVSFRRQMLFPADHESYIGDLGFGANPALLAHVRDADLILLINGRMSEVPSQGYTLLEIPQPRQTLIHVHADPAELGRVYQPALAINATPSAFVSALAALEPAPCRSRAEFRKAARADYFTWSDPAQIRIPGAFQMGAIMQWLGERLPADAILCNGAGNYAIWVHRFHRFRAYGTQLAPTSGSMGYGVPAAIAAKRLHPDRIVIAFAGDGCFLMNGQEFATAVQHDIPIVVIVVDNGMFGTIRMHQERAHPGRVIATSLTNPDFAAYATAFGGHGERVERTEDFAPAFERALASGKPAILHCLIDPQAITPSTTLSGLRSAAAS